MSSHLKKVFEEVIFSSNIIKNPESSRDRAYKKREGKRKAPRVYSNERRSQYFERRKKHFNFKNSF
jgi:hypothetical protein